MKIKNSIGCDLRTSLVYTASQVATRALPSPCQQSKTALEGPIPHPLAAECRNGTALKRIAAPEDGIQRELEQIG